MADQQETLLQALKNILHLRKNNEYLHNKLQKEGIQCSLEDVEWAREELKKQGYVASKMTKDTLRDSEIEAEAGNYIAELEEQIVEVISDREKNTEKVSFFHAKEALSDEEIYQEAKKDPKKWYIAQVWHLKRARGFLHSVLFKPIQEHTPENFQQNFIEFLSTFTSDYVPVKREQKFYGKSDAVMVIPKQDFHFDKLDVDGNNDIIKRQDKDSTITEYFVEKASTFYNLKKVYYVLGGDYFNSEYTKQTTKGTPQQNALSSYHATFNVACLHEMFVIKELLRKVEEVEVIYIAGNHDYYVCWHLVQWLAAYFRNEERVRFDASPELDKVVHYWDTSVMLRHGNEIKPQQLANIFPTKYKKEWSNSNHTYIITGDKHSEKSQDFGATRHYQVPALSSAKSFWDQNNGFVVTRTEHSAFIIEEGKGISDLFREYTT